MTFAERLRGLFGQDGTKKIRVKLFVKGRIGDGWQSIDREIALPEGATLGTLLDAAERQGIALREMIAKSPHLRHTLMLNGERCPLAENENRALENGDQVYLLSPLAGG